MKHLMYLAALLLVSPHAFSKEEILLSQVFSNTKSIGDERAGVAVSPSHLHFTATPGETETAKITINNDTDKTNKFRVSFNDFNMDGYGKSSFLPAGEGQHSLSRWINVAPSFVELKPGEKKELTLTLSVPADHVDANKAAWCILMIELAEERKTIDPGRGNESISFGITPTYAFGVFLYQNPPTVEVNKVDIVNFRLDQSLNGSFLQIDVENVGDGITYCTAYVELTNLQTGESQKLLVKKFTIVPGLIREFKFSLPDAMDPGQYSAVSVLDFGSEEELQAAELEFTL